MMMRISLVFGLAVGATFSLMGCTKAPQKTSVATEIASLGSQKLSPMSFPDLAPELRAYVAHLTENATGKGFVVFPPVVGKATLNADFTTGCARWLDLTIGASPELTQTPPWYTRELVRGHLERENLQLTPIEARHAAAFLGASHYAVGTVEAGKLSFQVYEATGTTVGEPVVLTGNEAQLAAGLPKAAQELRQRLGLEAGAVPALQETPEELALTGRVPLLPRMDITEADAIALHKLANHSVLGSLLYALTLPRAEPDPEPYPVRVQRLLSRAGGHPLVLTELARSQSSPEVIAAVEKAVPRLTGTLALAYCQAQTSRGRPAQLAAAERAVHAAPKNAEAWVLLARNLLNTAQELRRGRTADQLSEEQWKQLQAIYDRQVAAAVQAVKLDPESGTAYLALVNALTFAGDRERGQQAVEQALSRALRRQGAPAVFAAALEANDEKWGGSPQEQLQIADRASQLQITELLQAGEVMEILARYGYAAQAVALGKRVLEAADARLKANPNDIVAHDARKIALARLGNKAEALEEAKRTVALRPKDTAERFLLAESYQLVRHTDEAIVELQKLVQEAPKSGAFQYRLAELLCCQKRYDEALVPAQAAAVLQPQSASPHTLVGTIHAFQERYKEALSPFEKALALSPADPLCMSNVGETYCYLGRIKEGRALVEEAMRRTQNPAIRQNGQEVLEKFPLP